MTSALTISYNTPEYLERLLSTFRKFYDIPYLVIDGSDKENYEKIKDFDKRFNVKLIHFDYNIHHGPGMTWGINYLKDYDRILLVDSDMIIHSNGWLKMMEEELRDDSYGIGDIQKEYLTTVVRRQKVQEEGRRRRHRKMVLKTVREKIYIEYLHPAFAFVNREIMLKYPMPIKGGAPLLPAMAKIWKEQKTDILQRAQWLTEDLWEHKCLYVQHNHNHEGMGTVKKTGGYNLE